MDLKLHLGFYPYRPQTVLKITGEDALSFLQGQFTQELRRDGERPVAYGLWLTQKGKVLADSFILKEDSRLLWVVSLYSPVSVILSRLEAYVIADDVSIEDVTADFEGVGIIGAQSEAWIQEKTGSPPLAGQFGRVPGGFVFRGRRDKAENWEWLHRVGAASVPIPYDPALVLDENAVERLRIESGIPKVPIDIGPGDLPQEADLDADAVSYSKGCYLGQEVMARLRSMGQVRRRLLRLRGPGESPAVLPIPLQSAGRRIGELRSAASTPAGMIGLAMISMTGLDQEAPVTAAGPGSASLRFDPVQR